MSNPKIIYAFVGTVKTLEQTVNAPAIVALGEYQKELRRVQKELDLIKEAYQEKDDR